MIKTIKQKKIDNSVFLNHTCELQEAAEIEVICLLTFYLCFIEINGIVFERQAQKEVNELAEKSKLDQSAKVKLPSAVHTHLVKGRKLSKAFSPPALESGEVLEW